MTRHPEYEHLYAGIQLYKERCLLEDRSILWPDKNIWTLANLQHWKENTTDQPIVNPDVSYAEKLSQQLAKTPPVLWGLAADLHYVYYLPSSSIKFETRLENITWAAQNAGFSVPPENDPIWAPLKKGFTHTSQKYHFRYAQLDLLTLFSIKIKEQEDPRVILDDSARVQALLDETLKSIPKKTYRAYDMRHALLYLLFPEQYQPIISTSAKQKIASHYSSMIPPGVEDLDRQLQHIRKNIEATHPKGKDFFFYRDLRSEWDQKSTPIEGPRIIRDTNSSTGVDSESIPHPIEIVSEAQRLLKRFKNLILYGPPGTGKTFWADKIADNLLGPQLRQSQSRSAFLQTVIEGLSFYEILAVSMYQMGSEKKFSVPEIERMEAVQARFQLSPVKHTKNQIWGYLQSHTAPDSKTVNYAQRSEPYLFDKTSDSLWYLTPLGKKYVSDTLSDTVDAIKKGPPASNKPSDFIRWVTFHQSYAYEDFVEGLRPVVADKESTALSFEITPGIFRRICNLALNDQENNYVLIIDEINRGNIAKVFGELMTLLEADKRDRLSVELPYSKDTFKVPKNLFVIATMNTADRSIALLDVALRRRFAFLEILPEPELLDGIEIVIAEEDPLDIGQLLRALNHRIADLRGLNYQIGHSYFLPLREIESESQRLEVMDDIWNYQIIPLFQEYFYGQTDLLRQVLPSFFDPAEEPNGDQRQLCCRHEEELINALNKLL